MTECVDCGLEFVNVTDADEDDVSSYRWISRLDVANGGDNPIPEDWRGENICFDCLSKYTGYVGDEDWDKEKI
jgi:hypothetical protein